MNGIDAVVLATGNDFRCRSRIHAYAAKSGKYTSLSHAAIERFFKFWLEIPLALGTVGGLTSLHPLVKLSLEMLKAICTGTHAVCSSCWTAQISALRSLTRIQDGHMKMHLNNILNQFDATDVERFTIESF
jgi:hydroxymethylglutaryl-CoA reductase